MKILKSTLIFLGTILSCASLHSVEDAPLNLLQTSDFKPVKMHGRTTAAFGWFMIDWPRYFHIRERSYVPGDQCFTFECENNTAVFRYTDPLHPIYANSKRSVLFASRVGWPHPPAASYKAIGRYMFDKGRLMIAGHDMKPTDTWKSFEYSTPYAFGGIDIFPAAGATYRIADFRCYAVYPEIGGSIELPEGGKLTRFLLKKDAHYLIRWGTALWRGWMWKLTGKALPVEMVSSNDPAQGAFSITIDPELKSGWLLKVTKNGIVLTVADEFSVTAALFDYLRREMGCAFYTRDCQKIPPQGSVKKLTAVNRRVIPKYGTITGDNAMHVMNGGRHLPLFSTLNDVDYYHLANTQNDHIFNILLPMDLYLKDHPEYFMMDEHGRRVGHRDPCRSNPCFSNQEAMDLMIKNLLDYAKNQSISRILTFETGDASTHCLCPDCIKMNDGRESNTESQFDFANKFAPLLAKVRPDMRLVRNAYATRHAPPKKNLPLYDNISFCYCLGANLLPCTLHVECTINKKGMDEIKAWGKMAKVPERLGYMTYSDVRPLQFIKRMEYLSQFGNAYIYMFQHRGFSPAAPFVVTRWNLGEDPLKALYEFDHHYYGPAGKYIHEINLLVEQFASSSKHTKAEIKQNQKAPYHLGIWCGDEQIQSRLNRKTLDRIYVLFDNALKAVGNNKIYRKRVLYEKSLYLIEDLLHWNKASCRNKAELDAFIKRLSEYIRMAREFPGAFTNILIYPDSRTVMQGITGLTIPKTVPHWANEPLMTQILTQPEKVFQTGAEVFPGGFYFTANSINGTTPAELFTDRCPPRWARILNKKVSAEFTLKQKASAPLILSIEGLDAKNTQKSSFKIAVNGKQLYSGQPLFPKHEWGRMGFSIPASSLKTGKNLITVTPGTPLAEKIRISEIAVLDPSGDFADLANGSKQTQWTLPAPKNGNQITAGNGKVTFRNQIKGLLQFSFFRGHHLPKTGLLPSARIRMTIKAAGKGNMQLGFNGYYAYQRAPNGTQKIKTIGYQTGLYSRTYRSQHLRLTPQVKEYTVVIECEKSTGMIFPTILLDGPGNTEVYSFKMEVLPPLKTTKNSNNIKRK